MAQPNSPNVPNGGSADAPSDVNLRGLAALWHRNQEWRDRLAHEAARKSLDLPTEDMNITRNTTVSGIGTLGALGIAAAAGLPSAALAALMLYQSLGRPQTPAAPPPDSAYTVRIFDGAGREIPVVHLTEPPAPRP